MASDFTPKLSTQAAIKVCCLPLAETVAKEWRATHVLSFLDPCLPDSQLPRIECAHHTVLRAYDQERDDATQHFGYIVRDAIQFVCDSLYAPKTQRLLLHCHAGVSRSSAYALGAICIFNPELDASSVMEKLLEITNKPWPNRRIVEEIDAQLNRAGTLVEALDRYRERHPRRLAAYRWFNEKRGLISPVQR